MRQRMLYFPTKCMMHIFVYKNDKTSIVYCRTVSFFSFSFLQKDSFFNFLKTKSNVFVSFSIIFVSWSRSKIKTLTRLGFKFKLHLEVHLHLASPSTVTLVGFYLWLTPCNPLIRTCIIAIFNPVNISSTA
jgi:hypothetical protein